MDAWRIDTVLRGDVVIYPGEYDVLAAVIASEMLKEMGFGALVQRAGVEYTVKRWEELS